MADAALALTLLGWSALACSSAKERAATLGDTVVPDAGSPTTSTPTVELEWSEVSATSPQMDGGPVMTGRQNHAMAYDSDRRRIVLFGGWTGDERLNDTWEWDGQGWVSSTFEPAPPRRGAHQMAYDTARGVVVLTAGFVDPQETLEYDGSAWTLVDTVAQHTLGTRAALVFDQARRVAVLHGPGETEPETWEYEGNTWTRRAVDAPDMGNGWVATAYDAAREVTVRFDRARKTWEYDGDAWMLRSPPVAPPGGYGHAMAYDPARQRVLLFGGTNEPDTLLDVGLWEWDGAVWTSLSDDAIPIPPRNHFAMDVDAESHLLIYGGRHPAADGVQWLSDTWLVTFSNAGAAAAEP